jgi:hypothetical protein
MKQEAGTRYAVHESPSTPNGGGMHKGLKQKPKIVAALRGRRHAPRDHEKVRVSGSCLGRGFRKRSIRTFHFSGRRDGDGDEGWGMGDGVAATQKKF